MNEFYTALNFGERVLKSDLRIKFRGELDYLNAVIILMQAEILNEDENACDIKFKNSLEEIRKVITRLQKSEAANKNYGELKIFGLDENQIHSLTHNHEDGYILFTPEIGKYAAEINLLRTLIRRIELTACEAFINTNFDYTHVLNRLSSAVYNLIYEFLPAGYKKFFRFNRPE